MGILPKLCSAPSLDFAWTQQIGHNKWEKPGDRSDHRAFSVWGSPCLILFDNEEVFYVLFVCENDKR